jgi:hypothetical protein
MQRRSPSKSIPALALAAFAGIALAAAPALATPIGPGAFGPAQVFESFEGHTVGPNIRLGLGASLLEPGTVSAFTFASGVTLTSPIPNPGFANQGAFIHDFALGADVNNNWGGTRVVNDASDIPFGTAYLGAFHPSGGTASIEFSFASDQDRVGAYVTGAIGATLQLDVYDASGTLLESSSIGTVDLPLWSSNFLGIENFGGIRRVVISGTDFGIDGLTFEQGTVPIPEPGTFSELALGLFGIAAFRRRRGARRS